MKLFYAKTGDKTCRHCGGTINREEVYVVDQLAAYGAGGTKSLFIIVHYNCYIPWKQKKLQAKYEAFVLSHKKPTRMGRKPIPCTDRPKRRKLLSLRAYHTKAGNLARAAEITREIASLETCVIIKGNSPETTGGTLCTVMESPVQEPQIVESPSSPTLAGGMLTKPNLRPNLSNPLNR